MSGGYNDDYIKFLRLGEHLASQSGAGILGMITNNSFLDGLVHRMMRAHLLQEYPHIDVVDLHGSTVRRDRGPDGGKDENVFDIQQGVCLTLARRPPPPTGRSVRHGELWGARSEKYGALVESLPIVLADTVLNPQAPYWFLEQRDLDEGIKEEYFAWPRVADIFLMKDTGIETKRDALTVQFDRATMWETAQVVAKATPDQLIERFGLQADGRDWAAAWAIQDVKQSGPSEKNLRRINYRPFDLRWTYYTGKTKGFIAYPRFATQHHLIKCRNVALICTRQYAAHKHFVICCTRDLTERSSQPYAPYVIHPLYLSELPDGSLISEPNRPVNLVHEIVEEFSRRVGGASPEEIFGYAYAVFHSPGYRSRYSEFLKIDFPRLPLTGDLELFRAMAHLGGELVALHLLESPKLDHPITEFLGERGPEVEKVSWSTSTVWIDKARTTGFKGVREDVWNFHIGGYQVCEKWLKDRKGRTLLKEDIAHYQKIVVALSETIRLMKEIDEVIEQYGGWPEAFQTSDYPREETRKSLKAAEPRGEYGKKD